MKYILVTIKKYVLNASLCLAESNEVNVFPKDIRAAPTAGDIQFQSHHSEDGTSDTTFCCCWGSSSVWSQ